MCAEKIKKFSWLIFIIAKVKIFSKNGRFEDIAETALLLKSVILKVLKYLPSFVNSELLTTENNTNPEALETKIEKHINQLMNIADIS